MKLYKKDLKFEYMRGQGKGGQHRNKTDSCVRVTHIPTGIQATIDGRDQHKNKKEALKVLKEKIIEQEQEQKAKIKKQYRDIKIKDKKYIRTYDYKSQTVKDHRNGKTAPLKEVMGKGRIDLLI